MKPAATRSALLSAALVLAAAAATATTACGGKKDAATTPTGPTAPTAPSASTASTATSSAAAPSPLATETVAKVWSGSQPAADGGPARKVTLEIKGDGTAVLTTEASGKVTTRNGKWKVEELSVLFDPIEKDGSPGSRVVWALREGSLAPTAWSGDDWGTSGPPILGKTAK